MQGKSKTLSIVLASGVGALLGALFALEINRRLGGGLGQFFVALIGASIGGPTSWALQDVQSLSSAFRRAWNAFHFTWPEDFINKLKNFSVTFVLSAVMLAIVTSPLLFLLALPVIERGENPTMPTLFFLGMFLVFVWLPRGNFTDEFSITLEQHKKIRARFSKILLYGNPIALPFTLLYGIYRAVLGLTPKVWRLIKMTYRYAHSSERRVSFFGGAVGAIAGVAFESPIVGCALGALLALLEYKLVGEELIARARQEAKS